MTEICKFCKKPMKFEKEIDDDGWDILVFLCENEECFEGGRLRIHICQNCEHSWEEWD